MKFISTILFTACFLLQTGMMKAQWETQPEFPGGLEAMVSFIDSLLDNEAKRIFEVMPKWKPGTENGEIVRVRFTLPILFRLGENGEPFTYREALDKVKSERERKRRQ